MLWTYKIDRGRQFESDGGSILIIYPIIVDSIPVNQTYSPVGSVQYTCPVVLLCIADAFLSHYVGN